KGSDSDGSPDNGPDVRPFYSGEGQRVQSVWDPRHARCRQIRLDLVSHGLGLKKRFEPLDTVQPADAALAIAAGLDLREQPAVRVDPHAPGADRARGALRAREIARPDARLEPEPRGVRLRDRLVVPVEDLHAQHGAE